MSKTFRSAQPHIASSERPVRPNTSAFTHNLLRDQFTISAWFSLGALAQLALFTLPIKPYYAALPAIGYILWAFLDNALMLSGLKKNIYLANVLPGRTSALLPSEDGIFKKSGASGERVTVFHLGVKFSHPLGLLAPGVSEMGTYARSMYDELAARAEEFNFLGMDSYTQASSTPTNSQSLTLLYFKSKADVHRYAESPLHRKAWEWYNGFARSHGHIGVMHELYEVPAGNWESVYVNMEPNGLGVTRHRVYDGQGEGRWVSPLVDASRGVLSTTRGRLE